ncbi:MAG: hypothetical protein PHO41_09005, partial [Eubacteriales bacterium]|nr:hypothetical protein [Eubacteriales bacterium]
PWLWVSLIAVAAGILRTLPYLHSFFTPWGTWFMEGDPYYQMRLVDNMVANFPAALAHDPYALFPDGAAVGYRPVMIFIIAGIAKLIGFGHPSPALIDAVGAYLPPALGALMILPVYVLGKTLFKRKAVGIIAAIFVAVLPTEVFHRSILGFTDHHILETFLATLTLMFLALAWDKGKLRYGILAGVSLGVYLINWHGGLLFAGILTGAFLVSFAVSYLRGTHSAPIWRIGAVCFTVAAACFMPFAPQALSPRQYIAATALMGAAPFLAVKGAELIHSRKLYIALCVAIPLIGFAGCYFFAPEIIDFVKFQLRGTFWGWGTTIQEAMPYSLKQSLLHYGVLHFVALAGLVLAFKYRANPLFLIWTVVILLATVGQRRWDYYSAVNVCILGAFFFVWLGRWIKEHARPFVWAIVVVAVILTTIPMQISMLNARPAMTPDWFAAMTWLREGTPDPFGDPSVYYALETDRKPSYAVISWWDYGHWIIRPGHRVPVSSPTQQETEQGYRFFIAQSEEEAEKALNGMNVKYIVIDREMVDGKFYAMVLKTGATEMSVAYWKNSLAYRLFYYEGIGFTHYRLRFLSETVKIFERV